MCKLMKRIGLSCAVFAVVSLVASTVTLGDEDADSLSARMAQRQRQAIERLQSGDAAAPLTVLRELFISSDVEISIEELEDGAVVTLSSENEEVAKRIQDTLSRFVQQTERRQDMEQRRERIRAEDEGREARQERADRRADRQRMADMTPEERQERLEQWRERMEERMEALDPEERERMMERIQRRREMMEERMQREDE